MWLSSLYLPILGAPQHMRKLNDPLPLLLMIDLLIIIFLMIMFMPHSNVACQFFNGISATFPIDEEGEGVCFDLETVSSSSLTDMKRKKNQSSAIPERSHGKFYICLIAKFHLLKLQ